MANETGETWRRDDDNLEETLYGLTGQTESNKDIWFYDNRLKWYLIAIGKDPNSTESLNNFPDMIRLPKSWTRLLKEMVDDTKKDNHERYCSIATDNNNGRILLPLEYVKGAPTCVSGDVISDHKNTLKGLGADKIIGSIHTHPNKSGYRSLLKRFDRLYTGDFSAADLYISAKKDGELVAGVIDLSKEITFVFRTRGTKQEENFNYLPKGYRDQVSFEDYWYRSKNIEVDYEKRTATYLNNHNCSRDEFIDLRWDVNYEIAKKHNLAIYRGKLDTNLVRFYPPSWISSKETEWKKRLK